MATITTTIRFSYPVRTGLPSEAEDAAIDAAFALQDEDSRHEPRVLRLGHEEMDDDGLQRAWAEVEIEPAAVALSVAA